MYERFECCSTLLSVFKSGLSPNKRYLVKGKWIAIDLSRLAFCLAATRPQFAPHEDKIPGQPVVLLSRVVAKKPSTSGTMSNDLQSIPGLTPPPPAIPTPRRLCAIYLRDVLQFIDRAGSSAAGRQAPTSTRPSAMWRGCCRDACSIS